MNMDREGIEVAGENPRDCITRYEPYEKMQEILSWYVENWRELLNGDYIRSPMGEDQQKIPVRS